MLLCFGEVGDGLCQLVHAISQQPLQTIHPRLSVAAGLTLGHVASSILPYGSNTGAKLNAQRDCPAITSLMRGVAGAERREAGRKRKLGQARDVVHPQL